MKRHIAMLLTGAMLLSLTACSSKSSSSSGSGSETTKADVSVAAVQVDSGLGKNSDGSQTQTTAAVSTVDPSKKKKEIVVGHPAEPDAFVPFSRTTSNTNDDNIMTQNIYEGLFKMMPDGSIVPLLAKDYSWNEEGTVFDCTIRDDVYFSNGDHMTAEDVVWSLEQYRANRMHQTWLACESIEQTGDYSLRITLSYPSVGLMPACLSSRMGLVLDKKYYDEVGEDGYYAAPIGSGPYMCTEIKLADHQTFELNPYYYGEKPFYEKVTVKFLTDTNTQSIALENGDVDVFCNGSLDQYMRLDPNGDIKFEVNTASGYIFLSFNVTTYPSSDINFRKAVISAVNSEDVNEVLYGGYSKTMPALACTFMTGYPREGKYTPTMSYDVDAAKEYLKAANYNGEEFIIKCQAGSKGETAAVIIQGALINIGVNCTVKSLDSASNNALGKTAEGWHGNCAAMANSTLDTLNDLYPSAYRYNMEQNGYSYGCTQDDMDISDWYDQAYEMLDDEDRLVLIENIITAINERALQYPMVEDLNCSAYKYYVEGIKSRPMRSSYYFSEWY